MFSCKGKRFSSLLEINHILKTGTASRTGTHVFWRGVLGVPYPLLLACLISFTASIIFPLFIATSLANSSQVCSEETLEWKQC